MFLSFYWVIRSVVLPPFQNGREVIYYINTGICTWYSTKVQMQERRKTDYYIVSSASSSLIGSDRLSEIDND